MSIHIMSRIKSASLCSHATETGTTRPRHVPCHISYRPRAACRLRPNANACRISIWSMCGKSTPTVQEALCERVRTRRSVRIRLHASISYLGKLFFLFFLRLPGDIRKAAENGRGCFWRGACSQGVCVIHMSTCSLSLRVCGIVCGGKEMCDGQRITRKRN